MNSAAEGRSRLVRLNGVEASRGIAAVLVAMVHATGLTYSSHPNAGLPFGGLFLFAHAGVDFFFVLSGFIIYRVHRGDIGRPHRTSHYAWRRFVRIYPTYWIILAGFGLLLMYSPEKDPSVTSLGNTITSVFLLPHFQRPIIPNAWTLRHELIFYVLFGLLIMNRRLGRCLLGAWALLIIWNVATTMWTGAPFFGGLLGYLPFRIFNLEFFFGMGVALLLGRGPAWRPRVLLLVGIAIFLGDGLLESFGPHMPVEWPPRHLGYAFGAALALYGLVGAEEAGTLQVPAAFVALGTCSYSIYLTQSTLLLIIEQALRPLSRLVTLQPELTFLAVVSLAVAPGIAFSYLVEQPLLRRLRHGVMSWRPTLTPKSP